MATFHEEKQQQKVNLLRRKEEEESTKLLAERYDLPYANFSEVPVEAAAVLSIPEETARRGRLVAFQKVGRHLKIGLTNPHREETQSAIRALRQKRFTHEEFLISKSGLEYAWKFYLNTPEDDPFALGQVAVSPEKINDLRQRINGIRDIQNEITKALASRITDALDVMLASALAIGASDVHVEPHTDVARLRFRIDGVLQDIIEIPLKIFPMLLSRIKLVAELKLNVRNQPQDGHFTIASGDDNIEIRVSLLPGPQGENVVLRILDPKSIQLSLDELGMQPWMVNQIKKELKKTKGMILTTGPTGSGKTTTLYTFLRERYSPGVKIITIEDPIEYHIKGVEQTQTAPETGYTFASGLRAIIRQDPDVILVGEIRDIETAETAFHAALTGHLVFSTLHTNDAAGTTIRLMDLGVKPNIITPALNVTIAQRLVRKLCDICKQAGTLTDEERASIDHELAKLPDSIPTPKLEEWKLFRAAEQECVTCQGTGYKGRIGIYEMIIMTDEIKESILKNPTVTEIKKLAQEQGQITMRQDGILKVIAGITDIMEIDRVINV